MYADDESEQPTMPPNFIPALLKYRWYIVLSVIPLFVIAATVVISLPPVFRSVGLVMVETQKIPQDLVQTTVTTRAKERIEFIKQRVMTREKLLSIVKKYDYFNLREDSPVQVGQVLDSVRRAITVEVIESRESRRGPSTAIAFMVGFDSRSPSIAHAMANDLITLFLSENVKVRTQRATETTEFLRNEAVKVKSELDKVEAAVAEFKQQNKDSLPEHLALYTDMREQARERLDDINRRLRSSHEQIELLNAQMALSSGSAADITGLPESSQLTQLKERYRELSLMYKPSYPDLVALRDQIEMLENQASGVDGQEEFSSLGELAVRNQIKGLKEEIGRLETDKLAQESDIADLEKRILNIPLVERGLIELNRGYETKLARYNSITAKIMDASMAESLEQSLQAEKFSLIDPPILPRVPSAPDRIILMGAGVAVSFGLPIGFVLLLGFLDKNVRSFRFLERMHGNSFLIESPYIKTENEDRSEKKRFKLYFATGVGVFLTVVLVFHYLVMPLGEAIDRVLARFGIFIF